MKLLFDTDAFCKLGIAGLLEDVAQLFGATLQECGRLYALPFMLQRASLRRLYGGPACDALIPVATAIPVMQQANDAWIEKLVGIEAIDPGEVQIFSLAAEQGVPFLSGDKRALKALKETADFVPALEGHVITLEAVLLALCDRIGQEAIRQRVAPLMTMDRMVAICFSGDNPNPSDALGSYFRDLQAALVPLQLWNARG